MGFFGTNRAAGFSFMGAVLGTLMAASTLVTFFAVKEPDHSHEPIPTEKFFPTFLSVFKNKPYVILLFTYAPQLDGAQLRSGDTRLLFQIYLQE